MMVKTFGKNILRFFRDMQISWKLTLAYFLVIALPTVITGIYISNSITQSIIQQSELLVKQGLLQKREIITQKIETIERTSISIAHNSQILKFLEDPFENNFRGYENYVKSFAPIFENLIIQNKYIYDSMLYIGNATFPDSWNNIFYISAIENNEYYNKFMTDSSVTKKWSSVHDSNTRRVAGDIERERVFSLYRRLISFRDRNFIGVLVLEVSLRALFRNIGQGDNTFEYYLVFDEQGRLIFDNFYENTKENSRSDLITILSKIDGGGVITHGSKRLLVDSIPLNSIGCRLVGIAPLENFMKNNSAYKAIIACVIFIALVLFGVIIHFIANRLTGRLKLLVKALKSVQDENINIKLRIDNHDEVGELAESFNHMTERIHSLIEQVYKAQITEKESELKALEAQINPHFLYNTLSTISWMSRKVKAENIDNLSLQLSKFYRLVLSKGNSIITVENEINLLKAYIAIEMIRFENMFRVVYDLDEEAFRYKMVKIILQPIAENAINHGIAPKDRIGTMIVRLKQDDENLYFTVIDDGVGINRDTLENINKGNIITKRESGYAIYNIMERLKSVYGEKGNVFIVSRPGIGCSVSIVVPKTPLILNF